MKRAVAALVAIVSVAALGGCSLFGGSSDGTKSVSVFAVSPHQCFAAPTAVHTELSKLQRVPCNAPHAEESYAVVPYLNKQDPTSTTYPGSDKLTQFAKSACAQRFTKYVGINYLDSKLFFTYLLPSPRSWEQGVDRTIICFITSVTGLRTASAQGSKD